MSKGEMHPLTPLPSMVGRRVDPEVVREKELPCPSPAEAFRRAGHALHLGSIVEFILDVRVTWVLLGLPGC